MKIHYLEIVTPDVDASVALYSKIHGVSFGVADENLGEHALPNWQTAEH